MFYKKITMNMVSMVINQLMYTHSRECSAYWLYSPDSDKLDLNVGTQYMSIQMHHISLKDHKLVLHPHIIIAYALFYL